MSRSRCSDPGFARSSRPTSTSCVLRHGGFRVVQTSAGATTWWGWSTSSRACIHEECDYVHEGENAEVLAKAFEDDETVHFPSVYWDRTAAHGAHARTDRRHPLQPARRTRRARRQSCGDRSARHHLLLRADLHPRLLPRGPAPWKPLRPARRPGGVHRLRPLRLPDRRPRATRSPTCSSRSSSRTAPPPSTCCSK